MKLLELMVSENVKWPEGAEFAAQDKSIHEDKRDLFFYLNKPELTKGRYWTGSAVRDGFDLGGLAKDYNTAIITREQYEAEQARVAFDELEKQSAGVEQSGQRASELTPELDTEIQRTLTAADGTLDMSTIEIINEHLRQLLLMKREWIAGEWD